jgi:hypothetical protein
MVHQNYVNHLLVQLLLQSQEVSSRKYEIYTHLCLPTLQLIILPHQFLSHKESLLEFCVHHEQIVAVKTPQ